MIVDKQAAFQAAEEPTRRFLELLSAAITSGRAHVTKPDGLEPEYSEAWGWRHIDDVGTRPQGDRVGYIDGDDLYLIPDASYQVVQKFAGGGGEGLGVTSKTLGKRLDEKGLLRSKGDNRNTVRRELGGARQRVLHLHKDSLLMCEGSDQSDPEPEGPHPATKSY